MSPAQRSAACRRHANTESHEENRGDHSPKPPPRQPRNATRRRARPPRHAPRHHSLPSETSQRQPPPSAHTLRADARAECATTALAPARGADQLHASRRRAAASANASLSILASRVEFERHDVAAAAAAERAHLRADARAERATTALAPARGADQLHASRRRAAAAANASLSILAHVSSSSDMTLQRPPPPSAHTSRADARADRATTALAPARGADQSHASRRLAAAAANAPLSKLAAPSLDHTRATRHQRRARARRRSGSRRRRSPPPSAHTLRADARAERATTALAPARGADQSHASRRRAAAAASVPLDTRRATTRSITSHPAPTSSTSETS